MITIHVIGDSHSGAFTLIKKNAEYLLVPFKQHYIAGATAYNLISPNSESNSNHLLNVALRDVQKDDIALLWFGEIDCRFHIIQKLPTSEMRANPSLYSASIKELIQKTINNYSKILEELKKRNFRFAVLSLPPCNKELDAPDAKTKRYIHETFNKLLEEECKEKGYNYIDVYNISRDEDGFIKPDWSRSYECRWFASLPDVQSYSDQVHLNNKIIPYVLEKINEIFNTKFYFEIKESG